jgi:GT2 family glycosyltransferase
MEGAGLIDSKDAEPIGKPMISIVFLVYNRREELRESLNRMLTDEGCDRDRLEVIVVDNASTDGSAAMVAHEFPEVRVIVREENSGISGWNDGFAVARGDYVLALDDDCYLPPAALAQAMVAARERAADLVSFGVARPGDLEYRFEDDYATGLLSFWGCAVLMRREVLDRLGGFDPEIFVWAHELEFMLRFFDAGFRHLHLPDVLAMHMKYPDPSLTWRDFYSSRAYYVNARHFAYIAGKLLRPRESVGVLAARLAHHVRDAASVDPRAMKALIPCLRGYVRGLRNRDPVRNPEISRTYRRNFHSFASPWWFSRPLKHIVTRTPGPGRRAEYMEAARPYYPTTSATLEF